MDRGVGTCEHILNVTITCQRYGLSKPNSRLSTEACLFPMTSLVVMGKKLGMNTRTGQPTCCGLGWEPFLGVVDLFKSIDDYVKGCHMLTT
jgi:hypothetical protein